MTKTPPPWPSLKVEAWAIDRIRPYPKNARTHSIEDIRAARAAIDEYGWTYPILVDESLTVIAGHRRLAAAMLEPAFETVPVMQAVGWSAEQIKAYRLWDNKSTLSGGWDEGLLRAELGELQAVNFDLSFTGFDLSELNVFGAPAALGGDGVGDEKKPAGSLSDKFWAVPFSVLNAREGWWQDRKRAWLALGIESEVGRGENLLKMSDTVLEPDPKKRAKMKSQRGLLMTTSQKPLEEADPVTQEMAERADSGTSIFDPVLCELAYRWFCPPKGVVLDPFAGGSVRGIVASKLGREYVGVDLRPEQIEANRVQAKAICKGRGNPKPEWVEGDSQDIAKLAKGAKADFLFSCPPYADLERYSDDPLDLSTMEYPAFLAAYRAIIASAAKMLQKDRFACFVVGDIRNPDDRGVYRGFHMDTIRAFEDAGLQLYNHAILITAAGSLPMRSGRAFETSRKLGKTHQDCLIFVKGDPVKATAAIGKVEFGEPEELAAAPGPSSQYGERVTAEQLGGEV